MTEKGITTVTTEIYIKKKKQKKKQDKQNSSQEAKVA